MPERPRPPWHAPPARPDLFVAATAREHDATVLHDDRDFDLIAEVTNLSAGWIIPSGTGHGASG